jgi:hypothetical protein
MLGELKRFERDGVGKEIGEELSISQAKLVKAFFECMPAFPLSHVCIVTDLTPIATIDRRVGLSLSKGEGMESASFLR